MMPLLSLASDKLYFSTSGLENPHHVTIPCGLTAVIGPNGAGKSMLADIIERGRNFRTNRIVSHGPSEVRARKIEFADIHSLRGITAVGYYQQRYEATMNDDVPTVIDILERSDLDVQAILDVCATMGLDDVAHKKINYLSSGELRKLLVATALSSRPDLLILDNPYIGLDIESRAVFNDTLKELVDSGVNIMLLLCDPYDIPTFATAVLPIEAMTIGDIMEVNGDLESIVNRLLPMFGYTVDYDRLPSPLTEDTEPVNEIVNFDHCVVSYGKKVIIDEVDWVIRDNERWALTGPNGSGKSTLLSMINADNPSAYRSRITLFDRRRGTGETIWDIKRRIGFVSPEMRLYFSGNGDVTDVLGHGLVDTVGSFVKLTPAQLDVTRQWIEMLHLEDIAQRRFNTLSAGEKQLVLLARAMVKQPRLLILDEPMHGLDYGRKKAMRYLIDYMAARADEPGSPYHMSMIYVTHRPGEQPACVTKLKTLRK